MDLTPGQLARQMLAMEASGKPMAEVVAEGFASIPPMDNIQPEQVSAPQGFEGAAPRVVQPDVLPGAIASTINAWAGAKERKVLPIFDGNTVPFRGMRSALAPYVLKPGEFSVVQDLRVDDGSLMARQPTTDNSATYKTPGGATIPLVTNSNFSAVGPPRGLWAGLINGVNYVFGAWFIGSSGTNTHGVGLFYSTDGVNFVEASATSGAFGNSRMTDTGIPFAFQVLNNKADGKDYLVIQNDVDQPRAFTPIGLYSAKVLVINQFSPPVWGESAKVLSQANGTLNSNLVAVTPAVGTLTAVLSGVGSGQIVTISITTGTTSGDAVVLDFGAGGLNLSATGTLVAPQLIFICDQASMNVWSGLRVEVSPDGVTWLPINDPTSSISNGPLEVPFSNPLFGGTSSTGGLNGEEAVAFGLTGVVQVTGVISLRYIRLTWISPSSPASNFDLTIHGIYKSGAQLAFQQAYALSYAGLNGLSESAGVVMAGFNSATQTPIFGISSSIFLPYLAGIYYDHTIPIQSPSATDIQNGCDSVFIYRKDQGASDYFYFSTYTVGRYSAGNWEYFIGGSSFSTTPPTQALKDQISTTAAFNTALDPSRVEPSAYAIGMPIGLAMAFGGTRSFIGGANFYAISEANQPFRFVSDVDPTTLRSGTYITLSGQTINGFGVTSSGSLSANTVFMFSNTKTKMLAGFDGLSLSQPQADFDIGNESPASLAVYKDAIFWLDEIGQIRRFSWGRALGYSGGDGYDLAPAISKQVVSDRTTTIPSASVPWVCGLATFDRYYLFYTPSGQTKNNRCLVYDETIGVFVEDTFSVGMQSAVLASVNGKQILMQGTDGKIYVHENQSSSATHTISLTTRELQDGMWNPLFFGRIGVVMDAQSGQTMTLTKSLKPNAETDSSTIDLHTIPVNESSAPQMWRWDSRSGSTQPGLSGVSSIIALSCTMTPGTRIYSLVEEIQASGGGADQL